MKKILLTNSTRFSGLPWYGDPKEILLIGGGGIGSHTALNLSRIGHDLIIMDYDNVDITNVTGGQLYTSDLIDVPKTEALKTVCRLFGCTNKISILNSKFESGSEVLPITIMGVDNMQARKDIFYSWKDLLKDSPNKKNHILIDGRLGPENFDVFTLTGDMENNINNYEEDWLFDDASVPDLDCTKKQTTHVGALIGAMITCTLCNWITNIKEDDYIRQVPYYQTLNAVNFRFKQDFITKKIEENVRVTS